MFKDHSLVNQNLNFWKTFPMLSRKVIIFYILNNFILIFLLSILPTKYFFLMERILKIESYSYLEIWNHFIILEDSSRTNTFMQYSLWKEMDNLVRK